MMTFPLPLPLIHALWFKFCTTRHKCYCANLFCTSKYFGHICKKFLQFCSNLLLLLEIGQVPDSFWGCSVTGPREMSIN